MSKKHQEFIFAVEGNRFTRAGGIVNVGLTLIGQSQFFAAVEQSLFASRRAELERDERYLQLITYDVLYRKRENGDIEFFTYARLSGSGESRLVGSSSVGVGGHIDLADFTNDVEMKVMDVKRLLFKAAEREIGEELIFLAGEIVVNPILKPFFVGMLYNDSNAVGRVHLGIVNAVEIPSHLTVECREDAMQIVGFHTEEELTRTATPLEEWSQMIVNSGRLRALLSI